MAKKSKLELIMELSDKLFNNKLSKAQAKLSDATDKMEGKLKKFNMTQIKIFKGIGEAFDPVKINQAFELFDTVSEKMDFTKDINKTKLALQQMDVKNIDEVAAKIHEISTVFNQDSIQIAKAANAMTKQIGGSFESNLALLQAGYEKGANLNDDMIDQFKEYSAKMRESGLDASQTMALMIHAGKQGVFSDKAIDSIKEATQSLNEMGPAQLAALQGIGLTKDMLKDKTPFEAIQMISKAMKDATTQAKQLAMADIFKGAGEDAGMFFLEGLSTVNLDITKVKSFQAMDAGMNTWLAKFQSKIADTMGSLPIQDIAAFTMTIMGMISILTTLNTSIGLTTIMTKLWAGAQWLLNAAFSPFGIFVALIAVAIANWDTFGSALLTVGSLIFSVFTKFLGPIGLVVALFKSLYDHWESIKKAFADGGILAGLKRIGIVLLDALLKPIQQLLELVAKIPGMGAVASFGAAKIKELRGNLDLITPGENPKNPVVNNPVNNNPNSPLAKAPVLDGKLAPDDKKKKQGENVNRVAGQANQVKKIDIKIDSFNKGGINVAQSAFKGMSKEDVEAWFKEMLRRVVINAETI